MVSDNLDLLLNLSLDDSSKKLIFGRFTKLYYQHVRAHVQLRIYFTEPLAVWRARYTQYGIS